MHERIGVQEAETKLSLHQRQKEKLTRWKRETLERRQKRGLGIRQQQMTAPRRGLRAALVQCRCRCSPEEENHARADQHGMWSRKKKERQQRSPHSGDRISRRRRAPELTRGPPRLGTAQVIRVASPGRAHPRPRSRSREIPPRALCSPVRVQCKPTKRAGRDVPNDQLRSAVLLRLDCRPATAKAGKQAGTHHMPPPDGVCKGTRTWSRYLAAPGKSEKTGSRT